MKLLKEDILGFPMKRINKKVYRECFDNEPEWIMLVRLLWDRVESGLGMPDHDWGFLRSNNWMVEVV